MSCTKFCRQNPELDPSRSLIYLDFRTQYCGHDNQRKAEKQKTESGYLSHLGLRPIGLVQCIPPSIALSYVPSSL